MGEQRKDGLFRMAGIAGLAVLLLFTWWMRSTDRNKAAVQNPDNVSGKAATTHDQDNPTQHGHDTSGEKLPDQSKILVPSGSFADGVREVTYEAFQYGFDPDPLIVRAGEKVRMLVKSRDVEHGMMIPDVDFNAPMPLGEAKTVEFTAPAKAGEYPIFCSVFCGTGHGSMKGTLIVLPADMQNDSTTAPAHPDSGGRHGHR